MGILYVFASLWEKFFSQSEKKANDRRMINQIGEEKMTYSSDYFNKLVSPKGDNLPTRSCDKCGGPLNPEDKFCSVCGYDISSWVKES